ncbi:MAG: adenylosuccinate synthetase [Bacteroidota bacterium]
MSLTIVAGGQYGGEGKGLISTAISRWDNVDILVKTGGPNSAHSYHFQNTPYTFRMIPAASALGQSVIVFPPGVLIYPEQLRKELQTIQFKGKILIDPKAGIIGQKHISAQKQDEFYEVGGSTFTGTGAASAARAARRLDLVKDGEMAQLFGNGFQFEVADTQQFLANQYHLGKKILVEGCQGFGLSNYHGEYPYVSSRDNTVNGLMSQVGLGSRFVDTTVLVIKCFPTRNQLGDGSLPHELDIAFVKENKDVLEEFGGGSYNGGNQLRRVGMFDRTIINKAIRANSPDYIAITGLDKLSELLKYPMIRDHYRAESIHEFVKEVEKVFKLPVSIESHGGSVEDVRDLR